MHYNSKHMVPCILVIVSWLKSRHIRPRTLMLPTSFYERPLHGLFPCHLCCKQCALLLELLSAFFGGVLSLGCGLALRGSLFSWPGTCGGMVSRACTCSLCCALGNFATLCIAGVQRLVLWDYSTSVRGSNIHILQV